MVRLDRSAGVHLHRGTLEAVRSQKRSERLAVEIESPALAVHTAVERSRGPWINQAMQRLIAALARRGLSGRTFLVTGRRELAPPVPITVPFEPQPLNELESTLLTEAGEVEEPNAKVRPRHNLLSRNLVLRGGIGLLLIFGFNWVMALIDTIRSGRLDTSAAGRLVAWTVALAAMLVLPASAGFATQQWLLVPGGVVLRRSGWFRVGWELHLFDRRRSVLLVGCWGGGRWLAYVADGSQSSHTIGTQREVELLLRGWLSPLAPPPIERLTDLR